MCCSIDGRVHTFPGGGFGAKCVPGSATATICSKSFNGKDSRASCNCCCGDDRTADFLQNGLSPQLLNSRLVGGGRVESGQVWRKSAPNYHGILQSVIYVMARCAACAPQKIE